MDEKTIGVERVPILEETTERQASYGIRENHKELSRRQYETQIYTITDKRG